MFSWIIWLTWTAHDPLATGIAAGTMLVLALWSFLCHRAARQGREHRLLRRLRE
jgi:hypothetical protein